MTTQSILNEAPKLVKWGLERGLLSLKPRWKYEDPGYKLQIAETQRESRAITKNHYRHLNDPHNKDYITQAGTNIRLRF